MRYYIADSHFFHASLNSKMDYRGFSSGEEMNSYMLEKWNNKVRKNDEVIILGDLSWGKPEETNSDYVLQRTVSAGWGMSDKLALTLYFTVIKKYKV